MTTKTRTVISIAVGILPSAMLLMSAFMKLSSNPQMVQGLTQGGFGPYIKLFGLAELVFVAFFFIPATRKLGFLLLCAYLGGAMATELSHGMPPMSALLLALYWVSVFIKDRNMFLGSKTVN